MTPLIILLSLSLVSLLTGGAWTLALRGHTTTRSGPQVGVEYLEEEMARKALRGGKASVARKAWFWGKGWAVEREAAFSYAEIKAMWNKGAFGALLPMGLLMGGFVGSMVLGGLLMALRLSTPLPGLFVLAAGLYAAWLIGSGIRRA